jgi:D-alanyl-lipoteichoic acid acyltransferase DltB (MBOAT superfamily)
MLFNSYCFIFIFLPIALAGFAILRSCCPRWLAIVWLIACSMVFYGYWSWNYLALLCVSLTVNYFIGAIWMSTPSPASRKAGLIVGLVFNLSALSYFKYTNLFLQTLNSVSGTRFPVYAIILPLGISFFTFQKIAYLVDSYNGRGYSRNFLHYCLFVIFFPQLIAGPIVHPRQILPQLARRGGLTLSARNLSVGLTLFVMGLAKKVLIADTISPSPSRIFAAAAAGFVPAFSPAWLAALGYTLQIYFDFSGYSDMAVGLARLFGVRIPANFNSPYQAHDIVDFWRRWHMTLSRFLRDYLYILLGGNRRGKFRRYINLMITMLLGGLWHGANWTFLVWGGLHGLYLIINHGWLSLRGKKVGSPISPPARALGRAITFFAIVIAWVFFRAENFHAAARILAGMFGRGHTSGTELGLLHLRNNWIVVVAMLAVVFFLPNSLRVTALGRPALGILPPPRQEQNNPILWRPNFFWAVFLAAIAVASIMYLSKASEFIYYQF